MATLPHVKLDTNRQNEPTVTLKFNYGFDSEGNDKDDGRDKDYRPMARALQGFLTRFRSDSQQRTRERNTALNIPLHIDYIHITFQSQFVTSTFYSRWLNEFGLLGIHFSKFNNEILFAITDRNRFNAFYSNIENFIEKTTDHNSRVNYSSLVLYIKEFKLLTSADIMQFEHPGSLMNIRLVDDFSLGSRSFQPILRSLEEYLDENKIEFLYNADAKNIEIKEATLPIIQEITRNFDIVLCVTSALATVIGPSGFNLPERSYGFTIEDPGDLPIIGILDTGISDATPLHPILINDDSFNLTSASVFEDSTNHGTAVAALAALGKKAYLQNYRGAISADANLLSIKISDTSSLYLSQSDVLNLLRRAKAEYPEIKIFVLTTCYQHHKLTNEDYSTYAFELDKFAHENNCLVFICTANNEQAAIVNSRYDLNYFQEEQTNICTPAESMNNITVGAAADSLKSGNFAGISTSKEFPTLYTRKGHIDLVNAKIKKNKHYFKPDVIESGGDYESTGNFIGAGLVASMEVLSSNPTESFFPNVGTSFSTPLVANVAAKIQKSYPGIKGQSIKALIINSASLELIRFPPINEHMLNKVAGHGLPSEVKSLYSSENSITFLIEEEINPEELKIFPINFPDYLITDDLKKKNGILRATATLCFSFMPVINHQLGYCPIHMAFNIFKNRPGDELQLADDVANKITARLKKSLRWSQSGRHVSKPAPYYNTQKISFPVNVDELINETSTFKLAVQCRINPQLIPGTDRPYQIPHQFSIAITIEETLKEKNLTGKLYAEMIACNSVENIAAIDLDADNTADAEA